MQTIERTESADVTIVDDEVLTLRKRNRLLGWLSLALAAIALAFAVWMIVDSDGGSASTGLTAEQEQMIDTIDGYLQAWNDGDGEAAASFMVPTGYHDNGTKYHVRNGELAGLVDLAGPTFSVLSSASEGDVDFVGNFVMTEDYIPESATVPRPSFFKMTANGTQIIWHYAPSP